jgi:hypothetical protein
MQNTHVIQHDEPHNILAHHFLRDYLEARTRESIEVLLYQSIHTLSHTQKLKFVIRSCTIN